MGNEAWCVPDDCPASVCNGPHYAVRTELGTELLRAKQRPVGRLLTRWWRFAVLRGDGIPAALDGRWYDLDETDELLDDHAGVTLDATNRWEQRDDGEVAVVYEWVRR